MTTDPTTALLGAYDAAIQLIVAQADDWWSRFQAMLLANSLILAAIPFLIDRERLLVVGVSLGGLVFCFAWHRLLALGFENLQYWYLAGLELEAQLGTFDILHRHSQLVQGKPIAVAGVPLHIPGRRRQQAAEWAYRIIWLFVGGYVLALALALWPLQTPCVGRLAESHMIGLFTLSCLATSHQAWNSRSSPESVAGRGFMRPDGRRSRPWSS